MTALSLCTALSSLACCVCATAVDSELGELGNRASLRGTIQTPKASQLRELSFRPPRPPCMRRVLEARLLSAGPALPYQASRETVSRASCDELVEPSPPTATAYALNRSS